MPEPSPLQTIEAIDEAEAWALLAAHSVGRLVVNVGSQPDIFPVNYLLDGDTIVVRTAEGTKLAAALMGSRVAFEIDKIDEKNRVGWSVVVHGTASESRRLLDVMHDEELPIEPWATGTKNRVIHITSERITGRRLVPTEEAAP
jgi:nitroimidazol reductase NimA-like FMN-containing flavoprotein (pyridoxamine 5'-phosphate oxidase superfamily)